MVLMSERDALHGIATRTSCRRDDASDVCGSTMRAAEGTRVSSSTEVLTQPGRHRDAAQRLQARRTKPLVDDLRRFPAKTRNLGTDIRAPQAISKRRQKPRPVSCWMDVNPQADPAGVFRPNADVGPGRRGHRGGG